MKTRIKGLLIVVLALLAGLIASPTWALTLDEIQKLLASDGAAFDEFGVSVAVDGDTAVVGAWSDDDDGNGSGSAYVFTRSAGVWTEQQELTASDVAAFDEFGHSVAVDGNTAMIGAQGDDDNGSQAGAVYVFTRSAGVWTEQQKLTASDAADFDDFSSSIAIDGDTAVIGARFGDLSNLFVESDFGATYVFTSNAGVWTEQQKLIASDGAKEDQFGGSVAVDGDTAVIGAHLDGDNGIESGSAYVFTRDTGVWTEQQKLTASDGAAGHEFGISVAVGGDTAVIGAWLDDDNGDESGSVYAFTRSAGVWSEQPKLIASDAAAFDHFGQAVAMAGNTSVIGATRDDDNGSASGSGYVFAPEVGQFGDVPTDYWAFSFIETLANSGITAGCGNGNYCPTAPVTRAQMAVFLERGMNGSNFSPPAASGNVFLDVGAGDFAAAFIEQLANDGITSGCGNNNYCPDSEVTRDQMAVFLLRAKHGSSYSPPAATGIFGDVPLNYWAVHWIEQLAAESITTGCGGGNYCPEAQVTRDQMAVFLVRTFGL